MSSKVYITLEADDQATPVLRRIQTEMAKIKSKTVYVKVARTEAGSASAAVSKSAYDQSRSTNIYFNEKLSRSDAANIIAEQGRIEERG